MLTAILEWLASWILKYLADQAKIQIELADDQLKLDEQRKEVNEKNIKAYQDAIDRSSRIKASLDLINRSSR